MHYEDSSNLLYEVVAILPHPKLLLRAMQEIENQDQVSLTEFKTAGSRGRT